MSTDKCKKPVRHALLLLSVSIRLSVVKLFLFFCNLPHHRIWCQSSRDFARLRPFPINYRLLATVPRISVVKKFTRLHPTSRDFDRLRSSSNPMIPSRRAEDVNPWVLLDLSTLNSLITTLSALCRRGRSELNFISRCQRSIVVVSFRFQISRRDICRIFLVFTTLEELGVRSVTKVPRVHGAEAPGEPLVAALDSLITTLCRFGPPSDSLFSSVLPSSRATKFGVKVRATSSDFDHSP